MPRVIGITRLYYGYLKHLAKPSTLRRIAPLQLVGKIEDYLVKEFATFVSNSSESTRFCIVNSGNKNEPKIDLALIKRSKSGYVAEALIEAKYFRNRHRLSKTDLDAVDEHKQSLVELKKQLSYTPEATLGFHEVKLRSKSTKIYGLVFVSYARPSHAEDRKTEYFAQFLQKSEEHGFQYHDLKKPYLRSIYEDKPINVLGQQWLVTLRGALWRIAT